MARRKAGSSPRIDLRITEQHWAEAVGSASGGCLIADAVKRQYPDLTGVVVDMATIRVTDRGKGERYTYLTPYPAQMLLLSFDQGWRQPTETLSIREAVKVTKVTRAKTTTAVRRQRRQQLEAKREAGIATANDLQYLRRMNETDKARGGDEVPSSTGPLEDIVPRRRGNATVVGGRPLPQGPAHPNLLRGRDRHFGAKMAKAGDAWDQAVEVAVAERVAKITGGAGAGGGATQPTGTPAPDEG